MTDKPRRPMTDAERQMALSLSPGKVTYLPGSFDKRFARDMAALAMETEPQITEKQAALLVEKIHRYRRQLRKGTKP